jgi:cytochrome c-type biogenesis protein CcmH
VTAFILVATLATAVALAAVLWPLLRRAPAAPATERDAVNLALLKAQLAELEAERARGGIGDTMYAEAKAELERRALDDVAADTGEAATATATSTDTAAATGGAPATRGAVRATAFALAIVVPLAAALIYAQLGTPGVLTGAIDVAQPASPDSPDGAGQPQITREQIDQMVAQLAERLQREPGDAEGWVMLGRSYYVLQRYDDAVRAYAALAKLRPQDPDVLADHADALAMARGRKLDGEPMKLVRQALALNPRHMKSLAMAGSDAFERGDYKAAVDYWTRLKTELPPDVQVAQNLDASINEARTRAGGAPAAAPAPGGAAPQSAGRAADTGKAADAAASKAPPQAGSGAASVGGRVALAPELRARTQPGDTVFVVARAAQGPRMPLAVVRLQVKDLPANFTLDDSMAMTPAMKLSNFADVVVVARVSKSGAATPAAGDLEGLSPAVRLGARDVAVTIDRVLP